MRYLLALLFLPVTAFAAPFLVADVSDVNADTCVYISNTGAIFTSPVLTDAALGQTVNNNRVCKVDLSSSVLGTNNVKVRLRTGLGLWGDSPDVPFSFVRPPSISSPAGLRLVP